MLLGLDAEDVHSASHQVITGLRARFSFLHTNPPTKKIYRSAARGAVVVLLVVQMFDTLLWPVKLK